MPAAATCDVPVQPIRRYRWVMPMSWRLGASTSGIFPVIGAKTHREQNVINFDSFELVVSEDLFIVSVVKCHPTIILDDTVARVQLRAQYSSLACVTIFGRNSFRIHSFVGGSEGSNLPVQVAKAGTVTIPMSPVQSIPDFCPASGCIAFMQDKDYAAIHVWNLW